MAHLLNTVPEIAVEIEALMNLTGFNNSWLENHGIELSVVSHKALEY